MTDPFAKATKEAEKKLITGGGGTTTSTVYPKEQYKVLIARMAELAASNPDFKGLAPDADAVINAGASSKGSIRLATWSRGATPEHKAANVVYYRSGKLVATNVPLEPIVA